MKMIRTLIVDDEPLARQRIALLLKEEPDIQLLGECGSGGEALAVMQRDSPDLLFLDVQMPEMDGFALLSEIPSEKLPTVIFVTAFDQHALKAFEVQALDYLLKPFTTARFRETVQRARERLTAQPKDDSLAKAIMALTGRSPSGNNYLTRLAVKTPGRIVFIKTAQIICIESAGNYVAALVGKETHIVRDTINALEEKLDPEKFLRISRSAIVNLDGIKELLPSAQGQHTVVLHNGKRLTMTRGLREVEKALKFS
jgi:two-component system LytT family response regulator